MLPEGAGAGGGVSLAGRAQSGACSGGAGKQGAGGVMRATCQAGGLVVFWAALLRSGVCGLRAGARGLRGGEVVGRVRGAGVERGRLPR